MFSVSQRKARNDNENKRKVAAMFEDSGSEEESEKEIKTTVDRIVEESGKADQANSEGAVVELSNINNHLVTLVNQNLAVTNEMLRKIKSLEESQSELLGRIEELFSLQWQTHYNEPRYNEQHLKAWQNYSKIWGNKSRFNEIPAIKN